MINEKGDLLGVELNTDDRQPLSCRRNVSEIFMAIRGISPKPARDEQGINCYKVRKNMKPLPLSIADEVLLKKRTIIEVIKELKTQTQVEHSRHRSFVNFQVNVTISFWRGTSRNLQRFTRAFLTYKLFSNSRYNKVFYKDLSS